MSHAPPVEFFDVEEQQSRYDLNTRILAAAVFCFVLVVALLVFLHLYARYVLRRRRISILSLFRKPGLHPSAIAALPITTISINNGDNHGSDAECTICLSVIEQGERVRLLPSCRHVFHINCIGMWLSSTSTCPVCRAVVEPPRPSASTGDEMEDLERQ